MRGRKLHNPLHMFSRDKPNLFSLGSICLVALAGLIDTIAIRASEPLYFSMVSTIGAVATLYLMTRIRRVPTRSITRKHAPSLALIGTLFASTYICYTVALHNGPLGYVSALRGGGAVLMGSVIGFIALKERLTFNKIAGLACIVSGLALLATS